MSPHNHADCVGNYCDAILSGEIVTGMLAQCKNRLHLTVGGVF
jgi:hypothetical protein